MNSTYTMPSGRCLTSDAGLGPYLAWRARNPFSRKKISILGDSISTFEGCNPTGYAVFYTGKNCLLSGVRAPGNTWWDQTLSYLGADLLCNASYAGSTVCGDDFPAGCSARRIVELQPHAEAPDCVFIYMGINDWLQGKKPDRFEYCYDRMLTGIHLAFPSAKIYCATLCPSYIEDRPSFVFPTFSHAVSLDTFCNIIRDVAARHGCKVMDLRSLCLQYDSIDGAHPTAAGMDTLACLVLRSLDYNGAFFLNCRAPDHDWIQLSAETMPDGSISRQLRCRRCAAHRKELLPPPTVSIFDELDTMDSAAQSKTSDTPPAADTSSFATVIPAAEADASAPAKASAPAAEPTAAHLAPGGVLGGRYLLVEQIREQPPQLYTVQDRQSNTRCLLALYEISAPDDDAPIRAALELSKMDVAALPALFDSFRDDTHCYIVWEALPTETLAARLQQDGPLSLPQLRSLAGQIAAFWSDLRRQTPPRCYRAMDAQQILIDEDGHLRCSAQGLLPLAQALSASCAPAPFYRAPEEAADLFGYEVSLDVYHLGALLLQMATACDTSLSLSAALQQAETAIPNKKLFKLIRKCVQPLPRKRYRTLDTVLWDLGRIR